MVRLAVEMGYLENIERLTERCAAYKGQVEAGSHEIELLRAAIDHERNVIAEQARVWAGHYPEASDGHNTFVLLAEWIEARIGHQQFTQDKT